MNTNHRKKKADPSARLLLLTVILAAIILVTVLLNTLLQTPSDPSDPGASGGNDPVLLAQVSVSDLQSIKVQKGDETTSYVRTDGSWQLEGTPAYPLDAKRMETFSAAAAKIVASAKVADITAETNLGQYGLTAPTKVTVVTAAKTYTVEIGNKYNKGNSYYFRMEHDPVLYRMAGADGNALLASLQSLTYGAPLPSIVLAEITSVDVFYGENAEGTPAATEPSKILASATDALAISRLHNALSNIDTKQFANVAPSAEDMTAYGFGTLSARVFSIHTKTFVHMTDANGATLPGIEKTEHLHVPHRQHHLRFRGRNHTQHGIRADPGAILCVLRRRFRVRRLSIFLTCASRARETIWNNNPNTPPLWQAEMPFWNC